MEENDQVELTDDEENNEEVISDRPKEELVEEAKRQGEQKQPGQKEETHESQTNDSLQRDEAEQLQPEEYNSAMEYYSSILPPYGEAELSSFPEQNFKFYAGEEMQYTAREEIEGYYYGEVELEPTEPCTLEPDYTESETKEKSGEGSATSSEVLSNVYSKLSPFTVKWSFGVNTNVELINLTTPDTFEVFYVASHFGVIYNYRSGDMTFLPGHNYPLTSISCDASGRWLVTADSGEDTVIIIWDNKRKIPAWALYNVFPGEGAKCAKISHDARFLAAINCNFNFTCKFWMWTLGREQPDGVLDIDPAHGKAKHIDFNHMNTKQFAVTMEYNVVFCIWKKKLKRLESYCPEFRFRKFGTLRESLFLDDNHSVITSTSHGQVVVWCDVKYKDPISQQVPGTIEKNFLKAVKIHKAGITSLRLCDKIIMSSCEDGLVFFHDQYLRLMYWLPKIQLDPLVSVSFNVTPVPCEFDPFSPGFHDTMSSSDEEVENIFVYDDSVTGLSEKKGKATEDDLLKYEQHLSASKPDLGDIPKRYPSDCTVDMKPFHFRDFAFLTATGKIGYLCHRRKKVMYYLYNAEAPVLCMDCNPNREYIVVGDGHGNLSIYNYETKKLLVSVKLQSGITTLKHSYLGYFLMAGFQNGNILELNPLILTTNYTFDISESPIEKVCFSSDDKIFAFYDQNRTVYVYLKQQEWIFMGRYISHYKPIKDIMFGDSPSDSKYNRLFTIGEDRMLVEYDMQNLEEKKLKILTITRIEQTAIPYCFAWLSTTYKTPRFLISNNEYKLKVLDPESHVCQKTTLGPMADTPINFMKLIPKATRNGSTTKMIYTTRKHIGYRIVPPTGNPFEGMGMVAHPEQLVSFAISHDNQYVFTSGLNDPNLLMWSVNPDSVDVACQIGGVGLEPFISLIEGGPNSFLFAEIEDFFYYAQIIHQGEDPNIDRSVSKTLALCEVPDLFRSLGYYPTDYEVNNIIYELKHLNFEETEALNTEVTFDECVKAFLNHRPVEGVCLSHINKALMCIADLTDPADIIVEREELYKALEERAEGMNHAEVLGYLCILLLPNDEKNPITHNLSLSDFAENVLGIDLTISEEKVRQTTHVFENKNNQ